ncbi:MAG: nucleotidyl transferase AbiEii/AbiGii toxin family protein [Sulfuricurvum sp.]
MTLHENPELFSELITLSADMLGMREIYIEKDYWLCMILRNLADSDPEIFNRVVFKGGTALSKAHKLIHRFSEDIDLVYIAEGLSGNQIKNKLKAVEYVLLPDILKVIEKHSQESKGSSLRKTVHRYPRIVQGQFGDAVDALIVELNAFANPTPFSRKNISTYIVEFLVSKGSDELIQQYGLESFEVNVLETQRTLCEKISAVARASYEGHDYLQAKIRHFYDIYWLLKDPDTYQFLQSDAFREMMKMVIEEDLNIAQWASKSIFKSPIHLDHIGTMLPLKRYYETTFSSLVYGKLPSFEDVIEEYSSVRQRVQEMKTEAPQSF